ncbi:MAG: TIGR00153 family protein [Myxococcota bacterium]|nr:TIGR00153 family protein [Myxococcota bacterium]
MSLIQSLFGPSPIRPMQQHMAVVTACAREVLPLFEALAAGDMERVRQVRGEIDRQEGDADRIKNEIRSHLPKRLFLAVERRDMLDILDNQDSIADTAQDLAELADQRGQAVPASLAEPLTDLVRRVIAAVECAERVVNELDELVETGFQGREVGRVQEMIDELARIESETDAIQDKATRRLFAVEDELGVATVFWHQTIEHVADLADYAERVGNRLRLLIAT